MFERLEEINTKPDPFQFYTAADLWTDEHTSEQMLKFHLDQEMDVASRNHAFIDGNKRTAYVTARLFLVLHGHDLHAPDVERVLVFERLGKGEVGEKELAGLMRG